MWKPIPYEGYDDYEISDEGEIRSFKVSKTGRILKPRYNKKGYRQVALQHNDGTQHNFFNHRLVLMAFSPIKGMENLTVDHIDGNPANNNLSNLRWMTAEENLARATAKEDWGQHCYNYSRKGGAIKITYEDGRVEVYPNLMRAVEATGICKRTLNRYLENPNGFPGQRKKIKVEIIPN